MTLFPSPPLAFVEYEALNERLGVVIEWAFEARTSAARNRSRALHLACAKIADLTKRSKVFGRLDQLYHDRLREIEDAESIYQQAYDEVVKTLDHDEILAYASLIRPIVEEENCILNQRRQLALLEQARAKSRAFDAREERKMHRNKARIRSLSGEIDRRDRDLSSTDRSKEVIDERSGD